MANIGGTHWRTTRKLLVRQWPSQRKNGEHMARRPGGAYPINRSDREPERLALLLPIPRHLVMPTTQRLQIQMPGLLTIKDGFDDVRRQRGHPQHFGNPALFQLHRQSQIPDGGVLPLIK